MSSHDPSGALILGIGAGIVTFYKGFRSFREYKVLADTPRMPIRSVPMGFVHVHGKAESANVLTSPISKTPCCFYRVDIEQWKTHDRSSGWEHVCTDADGYKFYVVDDTGRVLVDAHSAEYDLPETKEREVNSHAASAAALGGVTDAELLNYISYARVHHMTDAVSTWLDKRVDQKLQQGVLDPQKQQGLLAFQQILHALPDVQKTGRLPVGLMEQVLSARGPLADPEREARRQMALQHLKMAEAMPAIPMADLGMQNQPAEGRFRLKEYLVLPGQEYFVSGTCVENPAPQDAHDRNLIVKGHTEPTFLISSRSDQQATKQVERGSFKMVALGAGLTLVCLALLLGHLGLY